MGALSCCFGCCPGGSCTLPALPGRAAPIQTLQAVLIAPGIGGSAPRPQLYRCTYLPGSAGSVCVRFGCTAGGGRLPVLAVTAPSLCAAPAAPRCCAAILAVTQPHPGMTALSLRCGRAPKRHPQGRQAATRNGRLQPKPRPVPSPQIQLLHGLTKPAL